MLLLLSVAVTFATPSSLLCPKRTALLQHGSIPGPCAEPGTPCMPLVPLAGRGPAASHPTRRGANTGAPTFEKSRSFCR